MSKLTKEEQIYERFVYRITRKEKEDIHRHSAEGSDDRRIPIGISWNRHLCGNKKKEDAA